MPHPLRKIRSAVGRAVRRHQALSLVNHRPTLIVLLYHQVEPESPAWLQRMGVSITPDTFDAHLQWCQNRYPFIALSDGIDSLRDGSLERTSVAVTFDDGMTGVLQHAPPILQRYDAPATLFVNRDFLQGGCHWFYQAAWLEANGHCHELAQTLDQSPNGSLLPFLRRHAGSSDLAKTPRIDALFRSCTKGHAPALHFDEAALTYSASSQWEIANHSCSHPRFSRIPNADQARQIAENADYLACFDNVVPLFGLPFGRPEDFNTATLAAAADAEHEFITAYGGVNPLGQTGADIRRIPCDSVSADDFESHLISNILGW